MNFHVFVSRSKWASCLSVVTAALALLSAGTAAAWALPSGEWVGGIIEAHGVWVALPAVLIGGLALNLTPCVYPMIPVTVAFFSAQGAKTQAPLRRVITLSACYVLGLSLNYGLLGLLAAKTGSLFGGWLQQPAVLLLVALVILGLSLGMFGVYEFRLPAALTRHAGRAAGGYGGAFVMGAVVGLIAAPCVGPFVVSLLLLVSRMADPVTGFLVFFLLGIGMGLPYLVLGVAAHRLGRLPKAGAWLVWSKKLLGVVLWGMALYLVKPLVPDPLWWGLFGAVLILAGLYLGWLERTSDSSRWFLRVRRITGIALVGLAVVIWWPKPQLPGARVAWTPYRAAILEQAQRDGHPALVDVYADWCIPCVEMDHTTFRQPAVVEALAGVTTLRVDVTSDVSLEAEALLGRYQIYGAPTVLFFDRSGQERKDLRLEGFANSQELLRRIAEITRSPA